MCYFIDEADGNYYLSYFNTVTRHLVVITCYSSELKTAHRLAASGVDPGCAAASL